MKKGLLFGKITIHSKPLPVNEFEEMLKNIEKKEV